MAKWASYSLNERAWLVSGVELTSGCLKWECDVTLVVSDESMVIESRTS